MKVTPVAILRNDFRHCASSIMMMTLLLEATQLCTTASAFFLTTARVKPVTLHQVTKPRRRTATSPLNSVLLDENCEQHIAFLGLPDPFVYGQYTEPQAAVETVDPFYLDLADPCVYGKHMAPQAAVETVNPFKKAYKGISSMCGFDIKKVSRLGVAFALSYSIISQITGAITLSISWYMSSMRTGLSPLAPGQWKSLLGSYGTVYTAIQLLRPIRVAGSIAMAEVYNEFLDKTQEKLDCNKKTAALVLYSSGWVVWFLLASLGISVASISSGVPMVPSN